MDPTFHCPPGEPSVADTVQVHGELLCGVLNGVESLTGMHSAAGKGIEGNLVP